MTAPRTVPPTLAILFGVVAALCLMAGTAIAATPAPEWAPAANLPAPLGVGDASTQSTQIEGVSCTSSGNCVAVGFNKDAAGSVDFQPMIVTETGGVWGQSSDVALPTGYAGSTSTQYASLNAVNCYSPGDCVAVGSYNDSTGSMQAMVVTETNGLWGQAVETVLPAGEDTTAGAQYASLSGVWCTNQDNCVAVGNYTDGGGASQAMVDTETNGVWQQADEFALPSGAETGSGQYAYLSAVSCTAIGDCATVGSYVDANSGDATQAMVDSETNGIWNPATTVELPSDADAASGSQNASLDGVSCTGPSACVAVGSYYDSNGSYDRQAMTVNETDQGWGQALKVTLPSPSATSAGGQYAMLLAISCVSAGNCVAGGTYSSTVQVNQGMLETESDDRWAPATESSLPSDSSGAGSQNAAVQALTCTTPGFCLEGGTYRYTAGNYYHAMVQSSVPTLSISTASLPGAIIGSDYQTTLTATGGAGSYTWSLASGSLPAGLTLNPSTGVISGTPQDVGTSDFTVSVSDPGLPAQSVGVALSIRTTIPAPTPASTASQCAAVSGTLSGDRLGPLTLGVTSVQARQQLPHFQAYNAYTDNFCLADGRGIRVGYATANLLKVLPGHPHAGGVVLALSSNRRYAIDGMLPGSSLRAVSAKLPLGSPINLGLNTWYVISHPGANWILKVRHGLVLGVGIASRPLTARRSDQTKLLAHF